MLLPPSHKDLTSGSKYLSHKDFTSNCGSTFCHITLLILCSHPLTQAVMTPPIHSSQPPLRLVSTSVAQQAMEHGSSSPTLRVVRIGRCRGWVRCRGRWIRVRFNEADELYVPDSEEDEEPEDNVQEVKQVMAGGSCKLSVAWRSRSLLPRNSRS
jgi:hypothetical protein